MSSAARLMQIRVQTERDSGIGLKLFGFIAESVFTFIPESRSRSSRNSVRNHPGIAFTFPRIPQLIRHTIVGVGEATFALIAPTYIADLFPEERRGRVLSFFYLAIPVGAALGYIIGGALGTRYGWRVPFYVCAVPGFLVALAFYFSGAEPMRGAREAALPGIERTTFAGLLRNPAFWTATLGMALMTFAIGGISSWMPTFLERENGMPLARA